MPLPMIADATYRPIPVWIAVILFLALFFGVPLLLAWLGHRRAEDRGETTRQAIE